METNLEQGDIVMCTVDRIVGTGVFVKIPVNDKEIEGSIILSEIAPGRIRNLRDYVVPKKRIACKVLRISPTGNIELSLRRVTQKEKKEAIEKEKQEKSYRSILKSILGDKAESIIKKIPNLYDFFQEVREKPEKLEEFVSKTETRKILEILQSQKKKKTLIKKEISLTTTNPNGLELIKDILKEEKTAKITYISAGRYNIKTEAENAKAADNQLKKVLLDIEKKAKEKTLFFSIKER